MNGSRIEAVIFDLGRVLIDFDHRAAADVIARFADKNADEIFSLFFDSELTGLFEEGKITPQDFFRNVKETLNLALDYEKFVPIWNEIFYLSPKNQEVYRAVQVLKQRYKLALISNVNVLHFEYVKEKFPVFEPFQVIVTSYQTQVRKPDPLIYQKTLEKLGVLSEQAFYTDDRPELVESACRLGIRGFVFEGPEKLYRDLIASGVDITIPQRSLA